MEKINGRTPDEIKRWLRWATYSCMQTEDRCETCEYRDDCGEYCGSDTHKEALAYIEQLEVALKCEQVARTVLMEDMPKWISVQERLPESGVHVFVLCEIRANGGVIRRYVCDGFHVEAWKEKAVCYSEDCALVYNDEDDEYYLEEGWYEVIKNWEEYDSITIADFVTHWMPMPEPPEEDAHE